MDDYYINVGTDKCCQFVKMSRRLMGVMEKNPGLYYAVEEALECAKIDYYGIGVIAYSQLLLSLKRKTPESRNIVAHEFLRRRPTKQMYDDAEDAFKMAAAEISDNELRRQENGADYQMKVVEEWTALITKLRLKLMSDRGEG